MPPDLAQLFVPVAEVSFLLPDEATLHGPMHELAETAIKGSRACRTKAQEMQTLVFEAFREAGVLFVDVAVADVLEPKMLPAGIRLIAHLRPHRNPRDVAIQARFRRLLHMRRVPALRALLLSLLLFLSGTARLCRGLRSRRRICRSIRTPGRRIGAPASLMLLLLFTAFFAMTRYEVPLPLAMSLVSCSFLVIQWDERAGHSPATASTITRTSRSCSRRSRFPRT